MNTATRDRLARGPNPRARVAIPTPGERCPRCHTTVGSLRQRPCLLCNTAGVPVAFGGVKEIVEGLDLALAQITREQRGASIES